MVLRRYTGNSPSNVAKDASYSVVTGHDGWEVRLTYRLNSRERTLLTTADHDELVEMVNRAKSEASDGRLGGRFYLNEFEDVLVPDGEGGVYWAGKYSTPLEFDFDGVVVSPIAPPGLKPGEVWPGPHVGVRHTLKAGGSDIEFWQKSGRIQRSVLLSDNVGKEAARELAQRLARVKGSSGGRIYINERSNFFSPIDGANPEDFIFLGGLDEDLWFDPPAEFAD